MGKRETIVLSSSEDDGECNDNDFASKSILKYFKKPKSGAASVPRTNTKGPIPKKARISSSRSHPGKSSNPFDEVLIWEFCSCFACNLLYACVLSFEYVILLFAQAASNDDRLFDACKGFLYVLSLIPDLEYSFDTIRFLLRLTLVFFFIKQHDKSEIPCCRWKSSVRILVKVLLGSRYLLVCYTRFLISAIALTKWNWMFVFFSFSFSFHIWHDYVSWFRS